VGWTVRCSIPDMSNDQPAWHQFQTLSYSHGNMEQNLTSTQRTIHLSLMPMSTMCSFTSITQYIFLVSYYDISPMTVMDTFIYYSCGWHSIVIIATCYRLDSPGIESQWRQDFPCCQDMTQSPSILPYNGYCVFPGGKAAGAWCWSHSSFKCQVVNG
jgi:hypothetical protein